MPEHRIDMNALIPFLIENLPDEEIGTFGLHVDSDNAFVVLFDEHGNGHPTRWEPGMDLAAVLVEKLNIARGWAGLEPVEWKPEEPSNA
jgi:hypothetical protein